VVTEFFRKLCSSIDSINEWVGRVVAWATVVVVVIVFVDVVMRYVFNTSYVFTQELEWHLFAFIFLMGAGATLLKEGHVRVDILYQRLSHRSRAWINLVGVIFFLVPGCVMIIVTSLKFVASSFAVLEGSPDPGGIPFRFIIKSCIPAGIFLVLIQGIALGIRSFYIVIGKDLDTERHA
jgi:TRAP-type mannitol/chloroaromatic compound transport system permease small subunit